MNKSKYTSRNADKFVVRLPEGMRSMINDVARVNHRSMNSEMVKRLQDSLIAEGIPGAEDLTDEFRAVEATAPVQEVSNFIPVETPVIVTAGATSYRAIFQGYALNDVGEFVARVYSPRQGSAIKKLNEVKPWDGKA